MGVRSVGIAGILVFGLALAFHFWSGAAKSEFGRYGDEGMHYVSALMIKDFALGGVWTAPVAYAKDYYQHLPKVGIGQWPPGYHLALAGWMTFAGESRERVLLFQLVQLGVLGALFVWVLWRFDSLARVWGLAAALLIPLLPVSHYIASMTMSEILLVIWTWLAFACLLLYTESGWRWGLPAFVLFVVLAMHTKGNGAVLFLVFPVVAAVSRLRERWLVYGITMAAMLALCLPYSMWSAKINSQGWDTQTVPTVSYYLLSLWKHLLLIPAMTGWGVLALAAGGAGWKIAGPLSRRRMPERFWAFLGVYLVVVVIFHVLVPTSMEARKLYQAVPALLAFAAAGLSGIASLSRNEATGGGLAAAALLVCAWLTVRPLTPWQPGNVEAAEILRGISRPGEEGAVLVSSNPYFMDQEAGVIAEFASHGRDSAHYVLRGTKLLLSTPVVDGGGLTLKNLVSSVGDVREKLDGVPVQAAALHTAPAESEYPHHALLLKYLEGEPAVWEELPVKSAGPEGQGSWRIWRRREWLRKKLDFHAPVEHRFR
jgi:hypothetical protein